MKTALSIAAVVWFALQTVDGIDVNAGNQNGRIEARLLRGVRSSVDAEWKAARRVKLGNHRLLPL
jgi:hypothetical protein